ncbi:hypothetical protein [Nostoc sp. WHI]|nr:hypothetical protein [Nostoc sp. WHI]
MTLPSGISQGAIAPWSKNKIWSFLYISVFTTASEKQISKVIIYYK